MLNKRSVLIAYCIGEANAKTRPIPPNNIDTEEYLKSLATGKLRWGAMSLPQASFGEILAESDEPVMHLGFGGEEHKVQAPQTGALYI